MIDPHLRHLTVRVDELRHHPDNARQGDVGAISESLSRFGQVRPIVVQASTGYVIAGNHVLAAARALGEPEIAAVRVDLDDAEALAYLVADNRTADLATYDLERQAAVLRQLAESGRLEGTGYDGDDVDRALADLARSAVPLYERESDLPVPADPVSRSGEVYQLGDHRLICGDSTDPAVMAELMAGHVADLLFTDPPYGVDYGGGTKARRRFEGDRTTGVYGAFLPVAKAVLRPSAAIYLWFADKAMVDVGLALEANGFEVRNNVVWLKSASAGFGALTAQYHARHELCCYAVRRGTPAYWCGPKNETTVWEVAQARVNDLHPTQKPVELPERAIRNSSPARGIILDPFAGSGPTLVAAEQAGRRAFLAEIDPRYCDVIRRRYADLVGVPDPDLDRGAAGAGEAEPRGEEVPA